MITEAEKDGKITPGKVSRCVAESQTVIASGALVVAHCC